MTTKQALVEWMNAAAAHSNRVRALEKLAAVVPAKTFMQVAGQHPDTMERDIEWAREKFEAAKAAYETFCAETGQIAYATYDGD